MRDLQEWQIQCTVATMKILLVPALFCCTSILAQEAPKPDAPAAPATAPAAPAPSVTLSTGPQSAPPIVASDDPETARLKRELARLTLEKDRLAAENALAKESLAKELAQRRQELERADFTMEEQRKKLARELEESRIKAERELSAIKMESERLVLEATVSKNKAEIRMTELRLAEAEARAEATRLSALMEKRDKELTSSQYAERSPDYPANPLEGRTLTVSDRRISLNGMIMMTTADEICARIDYFNNKDPQKPIFIVIDNSPGGSVMAGYRILKAMDGSKAPVHVVVKSFAASMAACITTLADHSYAYPNAVILHHQLSAGAFGNLQQQRETLAEYEEWWKRLAGPVSKKMGLELPEFEKRMYARVSTGDWSEFADKAVDLKWVDHLVDEIRETGTLKHPDLAAKPAPAAAPLIIPTRGDAEPQWLVEKIDEKGQPYMLLPRLTPKDCYWLFNADGYYRMP